MAKKQQITITITNPSEDTLAALALAEAGAVSSTLESLNLAILSGLSAVLAGQMRLAAQGDAYDATQDAPQDAPQDSPSSEAAGVTTGFQVGQRVHWHGQKFQFDGTIIEVLSPASKTDPLLRIKRDDTGKVVRLNTSDLSVGTLRLLVESVEQADTAQGSQPIRTQADLLELEPGTAVRWHGQRFQFDGTVEDVMVDEWDFDNDGCYGGDPADNVIRLRRNDTGKKVLLSWADLQEQSNQLVVS